MRIGSPIPIPLSMSGLFVGLAVALSVASASAQDGSMKACGEKWQAAKAANATQGATWPKFLVECRAGLAAAAATSGTGAMKAQPAAASAASAPPVNPTMAGPLPTFPAAVPAKFAELRPAQARQKACSEQYQANKAQNANGGLRWLEKGGGYWSLCNKRLKAG